MKDPSLIRVLVVDDDPDASGLLVLQLRRLGYRAAAAAGGADALQLLHEQRVDAVLLDLHMPDMGGLETLIQIRARWDLTQLPVLMLTASGRPEDTVDAISAGANDYLVKPCDPAVAAAKISAALRVIRASRNTGSARALQGTQETTARGRVCPACRQAFQSSPGRCPFCGAPAPTAGWWDPSSIADRYVGRMLLEKYFVEGPVGEGGAGSVYRIREADLGGLFAGKIMVFNDANAMVTRERIVREARTLARLSNPHIVRVVELLRLDGNKVMLVMEFVSGETLNAHLTRQGVLPVAEALEITRQVCEGLLELHGAGLVHRDIKPDNIMIDRLPSGSPHVRLVDLGIVSDAGHDPSLQLAGSPGYIAPEQFQDQQAADPRSDMYALGCVLFEMLTGSPPFGTATRALIEKMRSDAPPLPAVRDAPPRLGAVVARMLARDPGDRYQNLDVVLRIAGAMLGGRGAKQGAVSGSVSISRGTLRGPRSRSTPKS